MRIAIAYAVLLALPGAAAAQASDEQRGMVCMGDALQVCGGAVPDHEAVKQSLSSKRYQVSPQCGAVLDASHRPRRRRLSGWFCRQA